MKAKTAYYTYLYDGSIFVEDEWWEIAHYEDVPVKRLTLKKDVYMLFSGQWDENKDSLFLGHCWPTVVVELLYEFISEEERMSIGLLAGDNIDECVRILYK